MTGRQVIYSQVLPVKSRMPYHAQQVKMPYFRAGRISSKAEDEMALTMV